MKCCGCGTDTNVFYRDPGDGPRCFECKRKKDQLKRRDSNGQPKRDEGDQGKEV
jgi:hypothetical protein